MKWPTVTAGALIASLAPHADAMTFLSLRDTLGDPAFVHARKLSADASVIVGQNFRGGEGVFRWTAATGTRDLYDHDYPLYGTVTGISADGSTVFGMQYGAPFVFSTSRGLNLLGNFGAARGAADDASVVVGSWSATETGPSHAFRWTPGAGMSNLPLPSGGTYDGESEALACSSDGSVVVGDAGDVANSAPFRWTASAGIAVLPVHGVATLVSRDGRVLAGYVKDDDSPAGGLSAFRWTESGGVDPIDVGDYDANHATVPTAISADGSVIVGYSGLDRSGLSWVWTAETGMRPLIDILQGGGITLPAGTFFGITDLSADGRTILGRYGVWPDDDHSRLPITFDNFVATIPEPACAAAMLLVAGRRHRMRGC